MIDEAMSPYGWKIHCSITDPQLERLLHSGRAPENEEKLTKGA